MNLNPTPCTITVHLGPLHHVGKLKGLLLHMNSTKYWLNSPLQMWSLWNTCLVCPSPTMNLEPTPCITLIQLGASNVPIGPCPRVRYAYLCGCFGSILDLGIPPSLSTLCQGCTCTPLPSLSRCSRHVC